MGRLAPVAAAFILFGVFWGGWAVAAADVEREFALSHGAFGVVLSFALAGAAVANAVGGSLAERHGTRRALSVALALWTVSLTGGAVARHVVVFAVALIATASLAGVIDVVMNVATTSALADRPGKLVRFHALFNVGAAAGAGVVGLSTAAGISWRFAWAGVGVASAALAAVIARSALPGGAAGEHVPVRDLPRLLRRERLGLVAGAFAVGALVEGGIDLWGVLFLRTTLPSGLAVGATSAVAGYLVAAVARAVLGPVVGRRGATRGVRIGAVAASAGILLLAFSRAPLLAGVGFVLAAGGISMYWPLLLSIVSAGRERPAAVVGTVTSIGYLGFVVGPTVVGWVAAAVGLRAGLCVLAAAAAFVAIGTRGRHVPVAA